MASFAFPEESLICKMTAAILLVLISTVPARVASARCPDCTGEIKRIDSTGKCHSCFPCPECIEGYSTSSVPCGSTIPYERDIHCVEILQHPQESSQTSHAIFASGTVTSPSQIFATTANLVISATSSFVRAGSSIIQERESKSTKDPNTENISPPFGSYSNNTIIFTLFAISLVILSVAIVFKLQKKNKGRSQSAVTTVDALPSLPGQSLSEQDHEICHIDLGTNCVVYQGAHSSEMGDDTLPGLTHGTGNNGSADRVEVVAQLPGTPSCIDETPRDLHQPTDKNTLHPNFVPWLVPAPTGLGKKSTSTSTTGLFDQTASFPQISDIPQEFLDSLLSQKVAKIRYQFYCKICQKLDVLQDISWNDYRLLGEKVGVDKDAILLLKQKGNQTQEILRHFDSKKETCVERFKIILEEMGRDDVVTEIKDWILFEWQENIQPSRVI